MQPLTLYFLGSPRIERSGEPATVDTRKATALLAYLALSGERPSRDWLAAFLWPDFDDSRARAALRRTLSTLKAAVGAAAILANRESITLVPEAVWCDVVAFRQLLAQGDLASAAALYRDDFLAGFSLRDSLPFDDWQLAQQEELRRELTQALDQLSLGMAGEKGLEHARRWCRLDPLREEAHSRLMQLYAAAGRHAKALLQYRECVRILDEELGVAPLPETTALYHAIQNERTAAPVTPLSRPNLLLRSNPSPLVGREADFEQMQRLYRHVGPDGRLLIIDGEPGIGKSRLAETLVEWAAASGAAVLSARCYEGETNLAYAPIIQALQEGLAALAAGRLDLLSDQQLAEGARLLPQLAEERALPALPTLSAPGEQVRFYDGIAHLLDALLQGAAPGILWLDDVHWLDSASQELLSYLLHRWRRHPFLFLFCWRVEELPPGHSLPALVATLRRAGAGQTISPSRFTLEQVRELLLISGRGYPAELPVTLFAETEGLPFFVVEYLRALEQEDPPLAADATLAIPATVRDLLHGRLRQITATERQILQAAATIGHSFDLGLVQAASGRSTEEAVTALEMLAARGLLAEHTALYDFSHDKLRTLVYEEIGLARRRLLHRRLAESLSHRRQPVNRALLAQIAGHYQLAGLDAEAANYFVQAGDQARVLFAHQEAIHYYQAALALGAADPWRLQAACGELFMRQGLYPAALTSYETAAALAPAEELGSLEHQLAQVYQRQGSWSLAAGTLIQAQQHLGDTADPATLAHLLLERSLVAHRQKEANEALTLARQAHVQAEQAADPSALARAENILGLLARSRGALETAAAHLEQSIRLANESGRPDIQIAAHNNLALTRSAAGQPATARANLETALLLCERYGDRHYEAALRSNLADLLQQSGEQEAAREQVRQSAAIYAEIGRDQESWRAEIWQLMEW